MPKRDYLVFPDLTKTQVHALFALATRMKSGSYREKPLAGKTLGMIFAKSSTRTRVSFEVGATSSAGTPSSSRPGTSSWAAGEPIRDTARVLSRYWTGS